MRHYLQDDTRPGFNLALEQVLLRRSPVPAFWLWRNTPAVIVGRHQAPASEADLAEAVRRRVPVLRRLTGGGAVYHDTGTILFSFLLPAAVPVRRALADFGALLRTPGLVMERNDILAPDGRKIAGTAQLISASRRLLHGCLLWDTDLEVLARLLTPPPAKLHRHGIPSVRARVANLRPLLASPLSADTFFHILRLRASLAFAAPPTPIPSLWLAEAESLAATLPFRPCGIPTP